MTGDECAPTAGGAASGRAQFVSGKGCKDRRGRGCGARVNSFTDRVAPCRDCRVGTAVVTLGATFVIHHSSSRPEVRLRLVVFAELAQPDVPETHRVVVILKFDEDLGRVRVVVVAILLVGRG